MKKLLREVLVGIIVDNYIETVREDLFNGDLSFLSCIIEGKGFTPINKMSNESLIIEYKELFGEDIGICENEYLCGSCGNIVSWVRYNEEKDIDECKDCME